MDYKPNTPIPILIISIMSATGHLTIGRPLPTSVGRLGNPRWIEFGSAFGMRLDGEI